MQGVGVVIAVLVYDVWDEPCEASLITDVTAAVGVGAAMLLRATTETAHPPAAGTVRGRLLAPQPCNNGLLVAATATAPAGARHLGRPWRIQSVVMKWTRPCADRL
jgi:hypothetical protein